MKKDIPIKNGISIPGHELEITSSRSGGPGGQHVNKTSSRIMVRWNVRQSQALTDGQKERVMQKLQHRLTIDGDLIIQSSGSRSQEQNKQEALRILSTVVRSALHVPKKRIATIIPESIRETRLQSKGRRGALKRMRSKKIIEE
jgi:ribosome-associated protein